MAFRTSRCNSAKTARHVSRRLVSCIGYVTLTGVIVLGDVSRIKEALAQAGDHQDGQREERVNLFLVSLLGGRDLKSFLS